MTAPKFVKRPAGTTPTSSAELATKGYADSLVPGAWVDYIPTWTGSVSNPAIGNGQLAARYRVFGKTVDVAGIMKTGSTTTYGSGDWRFSLPAAAPTAKTISFFAALTPSWFGVAQVLDALNTYRVGVPFVETGGTRIQFTGSTGNLYNATDPQTWANGDALAWQITYEAA